MHTDTQVLHPSVDDAGSNYPRAVKVWLIIGLIMVFGQVVIGGITRLTGSGLSITKWEIVTGTLPPLSAEQWQSEFALYQATPQYAKINEGMSLSEFKFIYFWEYFHRLWARSMGIVFLIPFIIFWRKGWLDKPLMRRLGIVVLLAALAASFGWIMVASGLINRPWVNAYKLTMHLSVALLLYGYLFWTILKVLKPMPKVINNSLLKRGAIALTGVLVLQLILGGMMSGMKASLFYPSWPDMQGVYLPTVLLDGEQWTWQNFVQYDANAFPVALVQFLHRNVAYLLTIIGLGYVFVGLRRSIPKPFRVGLYLLALMIIVQISLGIATLVNSIGTIPVGLGVLHQAGALLLLTVVLFLDYQALSKVKN